MEKKTLAAKPLWEYTELDLVGLLALLPFRLPRAAFRLRCSPPEEKARGFVLVEALSLQLGEESQIWAANLGSASWKGVFYDHPDQELWAKRTAVFNALLGLDSLLPVTLLEVRTGAPKDWPGYNLVSDYEPDYRRALELACEFLSKTQEECPVFEGKRFGLPTDLLSENYCAKSCKEREDRNAPCWVLAFLELADREKKTGAPYEWKTRTCDSED
jgi:hypothetical protein